MTRQLCWALGLLILLADTGQAEIFNTLDAFELHERGWNGRLQFAFSATGGNTDVGGISGRFRFQWRGERNRWRFFSRGARSTVGGVAVKERTLLHLRHNYRLNPWLATLAFVQTQRDPFQRLETRLLLGVGLRFDVMRRETMDVSIGVSHMAEFEKLEQETGTDHDGRLSTFVSFGEKLTEYMELDLAGFLQPLWTRPSDYRLSTLLDLRNKIAGPFFLVTSLGVQYDSEPPEGVETTDWNVSTGLAFDF